MAPFAVPVLKKALVSSRLVFSNYAHPSKYSINSPFICLSGKSHFRPESKPGHREEWEIKVTLYSNILFNGLTWYTVTSSPASTCRALDLADSSRQLFTTWQKLTSLAGKFGVYWSTRCSPSRVLPGSLAHAAEVAPEHAWVWSQTLPCTRTLLGGEQPRVGSRMCRLRGAFPEGREGHRCPVPPVPGGSWLLSAGSSDS